MRAARQPLESRQRNISRLLPSIGQEVQAGPATP
jgi:hypothetical protein